MTRNWLIEIVRNMVCVRYMVNSPYAPNSNICNRPAATMKGFFIVYTYSYAVYSTCIELLIILNC